MRKIKFLKKHRRMYIYDPSNQRFPKIGHKKTLILEKTSDKT